MVPYVMETKAVTLKSVFEIKFPLIVCFSFSFFFEKILFY